MEFDSEKFKQLLEMGWNFLKDTFKEFIFQREELAREEERKRCLRNALASFYEAGISDGQIIVLAERYWKLSSEDAAKYLFIEKRAVTHIEVREYLRNDGKSIEEIQEFLTLKLDRHPELWMIKRKPEELVKELMGLRT